MTDDIKKILLRDQTTGRNILWANELRDAEEIQLADVDSIHPRHEKNRAEQKIRTRARAEIFTPPEACRLQNDLIVAPYNEPRRSWKDFIDAKFLEITCGEAPYITSRYNAADGTPIDFSERYGLLDRKLRVVAEETAAPADCLAWTIRAVQSVYGYEFQGDNLFLARKNIFLTVEEFLSGKVSAAELKKILPHVAEIISWNFWQMDGLKCTIPFADTNPNQSLFDEPPPPREIFCKIMDWQADDKHPITFKDRVGRARR